MRKFVLALVAAGAVTIGVASPAAADSVTVGVAGPAAADSSPGACRGDVVSFAVQLFDGRRAVADTFFGDYPRAVQDAQAFLVTICPKP
jgi:hypothetical protein